MPNPAPPAFTGDNPWTAGNRFELTMSDPNASCTWIFELGDRSDVHIDLDERSPANTRTGEIVVLGGRVMLWRGLELPAGAESETLDGAAMMLQLALALLHRAAPDGPATITRTHPFDVSDASAALEVSTLGAGGAFPAPWSSAGTIAPADGEGLWFDMVFTYGTGSDAGALEMKGLWQRREPPPALDEAMPIAGWSLSVLGPRLDGDELDFGATHIASHSQTLGGLRAELDASLRRG